MSGFYWLLAVLSVFGFLISWSGPYAHAQDHQTEQRPTTQNGETEHEVANVSDSKSGGWRKYKEEIEHNEKFITAISTIFIAAFTVLLAFATFFLWSATRDLVEDAKHSGEKNFRNMQASIAESKRASDAARDAVALAEKTAERQLRAYILPESAVLTQIGDSNPKYTLRTKNYGQTPAKNMTVWVAWRYFDAEIDIPADRPQIEFSQYLLGPQGFTVTSDLVYLDEVRKNKIRAGTAKFYLFGDVRYEDIFGAKHTTKYRFVWGGEFSRDTIGPLDLDREGNEAD